MPPLLRAKPPAVAHASPLVRARVPLAAAALALAPGLSGCAVGYYTQAIAGEASMMRASRPVSDWLADPATPVPLRRRLELAARIRAFASEHLSLPDNRSYTRYADLHRSSAVWNVFAAPALSLTLKTWCYPLFGCAGYRGYFDAQDAEQTAARLAGEGFDTYVGPVPAYSTLGWLPDPLLNTFIEWPEPELARLIFHELAHQVLYVRGDTRFNESFATAVEREGVRRWVAASGDAALRQQYERQRRRHEDLLRLVGETREELLALYREPAAPGSPEGRLAAKRQILEQLSRRYEKLRDERWQGDRSYDAFFAMPWNNARIAAMAAYNDDVPAFEALLAQQGGDMARFFAAVRRLAALDPAQRDAALRALGAPREASR